MLLGLKGKRALVTGGSRGIGRAIVDLLVEEGVAVSTCARGQAALDALAEEKSAGGATVHTAAFDVTDKPAFDRWIDDAAATLGGVDIFVSNVTTRVTSEGAARWTEAYEVDFLQHVSAAERVLPLLRDGDEASLVFISSIASVMAAIMPSEREYGVMKAALIAYSAQLAQRMARKGIRSNVVSPGPITFPGGFWDQVRQEDPALFERAAAVSALGRHGRPDEVARAVVFLASPAASYITGANLRIDGGALKHTNF